ncbi:MAG TPA: M23 family metallopeptidase [Rhizomicrobium sp.]|nr:M23 family metallopeptidase [Rhizomicrobium sp.]
MKNRIARPNAWRAAAFAVLAAASLSACATSPETDLDWGVNDRVAYGPRHVTLPPVETHRFTPPEQRRAAAVPRPRPAPQWYAETTLPPPTKADYTRVAESEPRFRWPLTGRILSQFGPNGRGERNDGLNIAASEGEAVHAAASGTVSYCGDELKGYGDLVLLRHEDGYITAYAHLGSILVGRGDHVAAGQVIATAGSSGDVRAPQLHFEIRQGVHPLDPLTLLPRSLQLASN